MTLFWSVISHKIASKVAFQTLGKLRKRPSIILVLYCFVTRCRFLFETFHSALSYRNAIQNLSRQLNEDTNNKDSCQIIKDFGCNIERRAMTMVSKVIIISLASVHLVKEIFQLFQVSLKNPFCQIQSNSKLQNGFLRNNFKWVRKALTRSQKRDFLSSAPSSDKITSFLTTFIKNCPHVDDGLYLLLCLIDDVARCSMIRIAVK